MSTSTEMQEVVEQSQQLNTIDPSRISSLSIMTNEAHMKSVMAVAKLMASSKVSVPEHLRNNEGDCAAVAMQAMNWGMDPFVVAQKTHLVSGKLGYEAQLVNAVVTSSKAIVGSFKYEYKDEGGTAPNAFVTCRVGAVLRGEAEITWGEWLPSASVTTRNSPLWKTNIKLQMAYLQVKNWSRMYTPAAILGVYTDDELQQMPAKELNARPRSGAEYAKKAQENHGVVIDQAQEERRSGLITALEAFAAKGSAAFLTQWRSIGKANRADAILVGEQEYMRILALAESNDLNQSQPAQDPFVTEMNQVDQA